MTREGSGAGVCLLVACTAVAGCDPGTTECACEPTGLRLDVCSALTGMVRQIDLSGSACADAEAKPAGEPDGGGETYEIQPTQPGECSVSVTFSNGLTFTAFGPPSPLNVLKGPGCCSGLYPDPLSAGLIQACPVADAAPEAETTRDAAPGS